MNAFFSLIIPIIIVNPFSANISDAEPSSFHNTLTEENPAEQTLRSKCAAIAEW
jgi:hypothetical protein